jgi:hypothetical protein
MGFIPVYQKQFLSLNGMVMQIGIAGNLGDNHCQVVREIAFKSVALLWTRSHLLGANANMANGAPFDWCSLQNSGSDTSLTTPFAMDSGDTTSGSWDIIAVECAVKLVVVVRLFVPQKMSHQLLCASASSFLFHAALSAS